METRTRIDLPASVRRPFEVFVNGVPQVEGTDYEVVGSTLLFERELVREGDARLLALGAHAPRDRRHLPQNDTIDVVFSVDGRRVVASLAAPHVATDRARLSPPARNAAFER